MDASGEGRVFLVIVKICKGQHGDRRIKSGVRCGCLVDVRPEQPDRTECDHGQYGVVKNSTAAGFRCPGITPYAIRRKFERPRKNQSDREAKGQQREYQFLEPGRKVQDGRNRCRDLQQ